MKVWMLPAEQLLSNFCLTDVSANGRDSSDLSNDGTRSHVECCLRSCPARLHRHPKFCAHIRRNSSHATAGARLVGAVHAGGITTPRLLREKSYQVDHTILESSDLTEQNYPGTSAHLI